MMARSSDEFCTSQVDTTRPNIWSWGVTRGANESLPFAVWANVTDDGVGIRLVNVTVSAPNYTLVEELHYNGSFYEKQMDPFVVPGQYQLILKVWDMNNNTRTSSYLLITIISPEDVTIDENLTMPVVVATSLLLAVIVVLAALMYEKRTEVPVT